MVLNTVVLLNLQKTSPILTEIIMSLFHFYYFYSESSTVEQCTGSSLCKAFWSEVSTSVSSSHRLWLLSVTTLKTCSLHLNGSAEIA